MKASGSDTAATSPSRPDSAIWVAAWLPCSHPQKIKTTAVVLGRPSASPLKRGPANWPSARKTWIKTTSTAHFTMSPHMMVASSRAQGAIAYHAMPDVDPKAIRLTNGSRRARCAAARSAKFKSRMSSPAGDGRLAGMETKAAKIRSRLDRCRNSSQAAVVAIRRCVFSRGVVSSWFRAST